jgi:hypothetical protein
MNSHYLISVSVLYKTQIYWKILSKVCRNENNILLEKVWPEKQKRVRLEDRYKLKNTIFWNVTPCIVLRIYRRFGATCFYTRKLRHIPRRQYYSYSRTWERKIS